MWGKESARRHEGQRGRGPGLLAANGCDAAPRLHRVLDPAEAVAELGGRPLEVRHHERQSPDPWMVARRATELQQARAEHEELLRRGARAVVEAGCHELARRPRE